MKISLQTAPLFFSLFAGFTALAQAPASTPDLSTPPGLEKIEDPGEPALKLGKQPTNETKVREIRANGKVTEVEVKTPKSKYTIKADQQIGNAQRGMVQGSSVSVARFKIYEFGAKKPATSGSVATAPAAPLQPATSRAVSAPKTNTSSKSASSTATSK